MRPRLLLAVVILAASSLYAVVYAQDAPTAGTVPITNLYLPLVSYNVPPPSPTATWTATPAPDSQPPRFVTWSFSPGSVSTANAGQVIVFTAHFTDDYSGLGDNEHRTDAVFQSPSGRQERTVYFRDSDLISGTLLDGVYQSEMFIPKLSEIGEWKLWRIRAQDNEGNYGDIDPQDIHKHLGVPITFQVKN